MPLAALSLGGRCLMFKQSVNSGSESIKMRDRMLTDLPKLHLGCADLRLDGWVNIDVSPDFKPDMVHDLAKPLPFADGSVKAVMAKDLLEHFDKYQRYVVFGDWARVLAVGGEMHLELPDFEKILKRQRKFTFDNFADFLFGETMLRSETYIGH
jgi:hypothetical protein